MIRIFGQGVNFRQELFAVSYLQILLCRITFKLQRFAVNLCSYSLYAVYKVIFQLLSIHIKKKGDCVKALA